MAAGGHDGVGLRADEEGDGGAKIADAADEGAGVGLVERELPEQILPAAIETISGYRSVVGEGDGAGRGDGQVLSGDDAQAGVEPILSAHGEIVGFLAAGDRDGRGASGGVAHADDWFNGLRGCGSRWRNGLREGSGMRGDRKGEYCTQAGAPRQPPEG